VDRQSCVVVPALPLQLLVQSHPAWALQPVAVVDAVAPQGQVLWTNEAARRAGIRVGLRYAAALGLCVELRAGAVAAPEITANVTALVRRLRRFTPGVEPCADEPGVFWLDGRGLHGHFRTPAAWVTAIRADVRAAGFAAAVVCGFGRFATYATAKALAGSATGDGRRVFARPADEQAALQRVPLDRVGIEPAARIALAQLGVRSVGEFARLPAAGVRRRFDAATERLHRMATGGLELPPQSQPEIETVCAEADLDPPEDDIERLVFRIKQLLDPLLARIERQGLGLAALELRLEMDAAPRREHVIRPAAPTLDAVQLLGLVRLRLESAPLGAGVVAVDLRVEPVPVRHRQASLFAARPRRDRAAAARALARLRAAFGDEVVVHARLAEGHLPEARFVWEPIARLAELRRAATARSANGIESPDAGAAAAAAATRVLVRRVFAKPVPLPPRPPQEPDGWLLRGLDHGPVARFAGPYVVSGAWWRTEIQRDYYVAEMRDGDLLWIYYDRRRRQWYLHGIVA
jgi:protein ImuB